MKKLMLCLLVLSALSFSFDKRATTQGVAGVTQGTQTITVPAIVGQKFYATAIIFDGDATTSNLIISDGTTIVTYNVGVTPGSFIAGGEPVYVGLKSASVNFTINGLTNYSAIVTGIYERP